jgi:hypothetical protein
VPPTETQVSKMLSRQDVIGPKLGRGDVEEPGSIGDELLVQAPRAIGDGWIQRPRTGPG